MQKITSEATSLNQIPALFRQVPWKLGQRNLDWGGGKYDTATDYLMEQHGVINNVYDPFNRDIDHNTSILLDAWGNPVDSITVANVLNVIQEYEVRRDLLYSLKHFINPHGIIYLSVHEGDRSGKGAVTSKGWQENRKRFTYLGEIRNVYPETYYEHGYYRAYP